MKLRAKKLDNLKSKVNEYKNNLVAKYLNEKGYKCINTLESLNKINNILRTNKQKVMLEIKNEMLSKLGSYYIWEAYVKVKLIDIVTGKEL